MDGQKDKSNTGSNNSNSLSSQNGEEVHQQNGPIIQELEDGSSYSDHHNDTSAIHLESSDDDFSYRADSPLELIDRKDLQNSDNIPLIPTDFASITEALQNFAAVFESRYGAQHAPFYDGSLQRALTDAFDFPDIEERRPLALYLHHDEAVASHIFPQTVLCSMEVSNLLRCQFIVWAWDMTQHQNRQTFYEWLNMNNLGGVIADSIRVIAPNKYPLLVVLVKDRAQFHRSTLIYGQESKESTIQKLMVSLDHYQQIREQERQEERNRMEREQFRREQAEEYERSLAADRVKEQEKRRKQEEAREAEEKKQQEEQQKQRKMSALAKILPTEPAENEPNVIKIRFRCPNGELKDRRFRPDESIEMMMIFAETIGFDRDQHQFWTSDKPHKEVNEMDTAKSFAEMGWRRELITIREV